MGSALRSFSATTYASRTNCTVTAPSGITDGDILTLIFIHFNTSSTPPTITLPTGFSSNIRSGFPKNYNNGSDYVHVWVSDKTAASESGDYTITHSSGTTQGMMLCISDADTTAAKIGSWNTGNSTTTTATSVTTNDDDSLVAFVDMNWQLFGSESPPTGTTPTFTEQSDSSSSLIYLATGVLATAGATGDKSHDNGNGSAFPWAGMLLAWDAADLGQLVYPTTDTTRDNWEEDDGTTTNIYDQIDEATPDDADYIRTQTGPSSDVYVTKFGSVTDPSSSTGHKVSVRYGKDSAGGDTISLVAQLRQGYTNESSQGTLIATALNNTNISSGWTTATYTLTSGEADSITDYSSLYLRLVGNVEAVGYSTTPPSHRNTSNFAQSTTSVNINNATNSEGDVAIMVVESSDSTTAAGTPNTPSNWTKIFEDTEGAGSSGVTTLTVFARIVPAGGLSGTTTTVDGVGDHVGGAMTCISGHGLASVSDIVVGTASKHGTTQTGCSTSGITVTANSMVVLCIAFSDDASDTSNASTYSNSNLATITEREDETNTNGAGGGVAITTATCAGTTTGATTWNHDTAANSLSVMLGIRPPLAPRRAQVSWARLQVPTSTGTPATANPTGVAGTGAAGTGFAFVTDQVFAITAAGATGAAGTATAATDQVFAITAAGATGAAGTVSVSISVDATATPPGVAATGAAGTSFSFVTDQVFAIAGVGASGFAGTAIATTPDVTVMVNGVAATGAVNTVTISTSVTAAITAQAATGAAGTATATGGATATVTGAAGTGAAGTGFTFVTDQIFPIAGVAASGALGTVQAISPDSTTIISGVGAAGLAGTVTLTTTAALTLTGVAAAGAAGTATATATGDALATPTGVAATSAAGALSLICDAAVSAVGASASGFAGSFSITGDANVGITGASAVAAVGSVLTTSQLAGLILTVNALRSRTTCTRPAIEAPAQAATSRTVATRPALEAPAESMVSRTTATRPRVTING